MNTWHFTGPPGSRNDNLDFVQPREGRDEYARFWAVYFPIVKRRRKRWEQNDPRTRPSALQRFVHKGVPATFRKEIWMRNCPPRGVPKVEIVPDSVTEAIRLDLPRTFPDNEWLRSPIVRNALGRALYVVAQHEPQVGYCQGLNFIAGLALIVLRNEDHATDLVLRIIRQRPDRYGPQMSGLRSDAKVLHHLLSQRCPDVTRTLEKLDVGLDLLKFQTVLRIWDCCLYDGDIWLFRVAVVLIDSHHEKISRCTTFDQLITVFQQIDNSRAARYCHELIQKAGKESFTQQDIDSLRAKFDANLH